MTKHHAENERIKRKYFIFLKEAKRQNESSVDAVAKAVSRFETYTKHRDFKAFHFEQAVGLKPSCQTKQPANGGKVKQGHVAFDLGAIESFFSMVGDAARV